MFKQSEVDTLPVSVLKRISRDRLLDFSNGIQNFIWLFLLIADSIIAVSMQPTKPSLKKSAAIIQQVKRFYLCDFSMSPGYVDESAKTKYKRSLQQFME